MIISLKNKRVKKLTDNNLQTVGNYFLYYNPNKNKFYDYLYKKQPIKNNPQGTVT